MPDARRRPGDDAALATSCKRIGVMSTPPLRASSSSTCLGMSGVCVRGGPLGYQLPLLALLFSPVLTYRDGTSASRSRVRKQNTVYS